VNSGIWETVQEVFANAVEQPSSDRVMYVRQACDGMPEVQAEVESLLAAHDRADSFIEPVPLTIGPYRLAERIGQGGMGSVYRAERLDGQLQQQVAIKLLSRAASAVLYRRFLEERQILANLSHPNIAGFLDAGITPSGISFLVMECVEGVPVDKYSQDRTVRERLELFRTICAAVHYAHQNLVVHRDLKPANILVTAAGQPKLLDFGIAKLLARAPDGSHTLMTAMTPNYASPEQILGRSISTASDIYSLGVLLHELLTGRRPYDLSGRTLEEVTRRVCEQELDPPQTGSKDLDAILAKAMRKEPNERYASAEALSADIDRFLTNRPVEARRGALTYVLLKFLARNKSSVAAGIVILSLLAGAGLYSARQSRIATRRFADVRQLARAVVFPIYDSVAVLPGSTPARKVILGNALEYLDKLSLDARGDVALQLELAQTYSRLGDVQGWHAQANLGDQPGAIASYRKSYALFKESLRQRPEDVAARMNFADVCRRLGTVLFVARQKQEGRQIVGEAVSTMEALMRNAPSEANRRSLVAAYSSMADVSDEDLSYRYKALELSEELLAEKPADWQRQRDVALTHKYIAARLVPRAFKDRALVHLARAEELDKARLAANPQSREARLDLSFDYSQNAMFYRNRMQFDRALSEFRKALDIRSSLAASDPADARMQDRLAYVHSQIAFTLMESKRPKEALPQLEQAQRIARTLLARDPNNVQFRSTLARLQQQFGDALLASGHTVRACRSWREARSAFDSLESQGRLGEEERLAMGRIGEHLQRCPAS
jgi:tetratricopeptide (TPR) repeat protein